MVGLPPVRKIPCIVGLGGLAAILFILSIGIGPVSIWPQDVAFALLGHGKSDYRIIVQDIRLPRALLALGIGATSGLCGAAMQGLLRNPLAAPSLFGAPQSAAFVAVALISLGWSDTLSWSLPLAAICGAFISVFLLIAIAGPKANLLLLILAGLAISSLAGAGTALAMNLSPNPFAALEIAFWLLGSLEDRSMRHVLMAFPFMAVSCLLILSQAQSFRMLGIGEDAAQSLGLNVGRLRLIVIAAVAIGIGGAVSVAGTIGFIGLIAPQLARALVANDATKALWPSAWIGSCLLLAADIGVRLIPSTTDIKVGVLTSIVGVPFFLYLIVRQRRALAGGLA